MIELKFMCPNVEILRDEMTAAFIALYPGSTLVLDGKPIIGRNALLSSTAPAVAGNGASGPKTTPSSADVKAAPAETLGSVVGTTATVVPANKKAEKAAVAAEAEKTRLAEEARQAELAAGADEPDQADEPDPLAEESEEPAAEVTKEDCLTLLQELRSKAANDPNALTKVLANFGVTKFAAIKPEQYAGLRARTAEALRALGA